MGSMSGMGAGLGLNTSNPVLLSAFHHTLLLQLAVVVVAAAFSPLLWSLIRPGVLRWSGRHDARSASNPGGPGPGAAAAAGSAATATGEPLARRVLRIGFGLLWLLDGLLQAQSAMPVGLPTQVTGPAATGSPGWLVHLVSWANTGWKNHPVEAAAAVVWIQVGLGAWMLLVPRGRFSRLAGVAGVGWGLVVWVFGEAMGAILAPGATWLFGAPGAVLLYAGAGALLAAPDRAWRTGVLGRWLLGSMGAFFVVMAGLQAWPGRGYWQGGSQGPVPSMVDRMAQTAQPHVLARTLERFGQFGSGHGWAVNLFVVAALVGVGGSLLSGRERLVRPAVVAGVVLCLADWVLVQDLGFLGGLGTDPNSGVPQVLLLVAGYLAWARAPAPAPAPASAPASAVEPAREPVGPPVPARLSLGPRQAARAFGSGGVGVMMAVGAVPMALVVSGGNTSPVVAEAVSGLPSGLASGAPDFQLVDQHGARVRLSALRGKVVVLTFLDPVCTSACPLIAQQLRQADQILGAQSAAAEMVVVNTNPLYTTTAVLRAFDDQENLGRLANWVYLTGSPAQLRRVWDDYNVQVSVSPDGAMIDHSQLVYVIGPGGRMRWVSNDAPINPNTDSDAAWTSQYQSSFAVTVADEVRDLAVGR
jgi:cytochrome oxidase Cu insertion factor (SCO1/SenC/PrrC family)